jgi:hypothetical protein
MSVGIPISDFIGSELRKNYLEGFWYTGKLFDEKPLCAGKFQLFTVKQLKEKIEREKPKKHEGPASFSLVIKKINGSYYSLVNMVMMQEDPANADAVFQLASRPGGVETDNFDNRMPPTDSSWVKTQGPLMTASAAPGGLLRTIKSGELACFKYVSPESIDKIRDNMTVCWHENIDVIQYKSGWKPCGHRVNQVLALAKQMPDRKYSKEDAGKIVRAYLKVAYEGTLLAASAHGKRRVFLTAVGGGIYNNKLDDIAWAIEQCKGIIKDGSCPE